MAGKGVGKAPRSRLFRLCARRTASDCTRSPSPRPPLPACEADLAMANEWGWRSATRAEARELAARVLAMAGKWGWRSA